MTEYELLSYDLGGVKLTDASTITFLGWVAKKINNMKNTNPFASELTSLVRNPPMGKMTDMTKIDIIRKLEKAGIEL